MFDGATLAEKWKSINLPSSSWGEVYDIQLADLDGDGHPEIAASVAGDRVYVFDGVTHKMKWLGAVPAYALETADVNHDGKTELLVGKDDGTVEVYDGSNFVSVAVHIVGAGAIEGLSVADINKDGRSEWLLSESSTFSVYDRPTRSIVSRKSGLGDSVAAYNHINVLDSDGDGGKEIVIGTSGVLVQFGVK